MQAILAPDNTITAEQEKRREERRQRNALAISDVVGRNPARRVPDNFRSAVYGRLNTPPKHANN